MNDHLDDAHSSADRRMTLEQLRFFVLVAEEKSFEKASERLERTQSAVTQGIKKLEYILGYQLLDRRHGHLAGLTTKGERFLLLARNLLAQSASIIESLQYSDLVGKIRLGIPDDLDFDLFYAAIVRCTSLNPSLEINTTSLAPAHLVRLFRQGNLDVAIVRQLVYPDPFQTATSFTQLRREPLFWISGNAQLILPNQAVNLVSMGEGCAYHEAAVKALEQAGYQTRLVYSSHSWHNVRQAVLNNMGIAVVPSSLLEQKFNVHTLNEGLPQLPDTEMRILYRNDEDLTLRFARALSMLLKPQLSTQIE